MQILSTNDHPPFFFIDGLVIRTFFGTNCLHLYLFPSCTFAEQATTITHIYGTKKRGTTYASRVDGVYLGLCQVLLSHLERNDLWKYIRSKLVQY